MSISLIIIYSLFCLFKKETKKDTANRPVIDWRKQLCPAILQSDLSCSNAILRLNNYNYLATLLDLYKPVDNYNNSLIYKPKSSITAVEATVVQLLTRAVPRHRAVIDAGSPFCSFLAKQKGGRKK